MKQSEILLSFNTAISKIENKNDSEFNRIIKILRNSINVQKANTGLEITLKSLCCAKCSNSEKTKLGYAAKLLLDDNLIDEKFIEFFNKFISDNLTNEDIALFENQEINYSKSDELIRITEKKLQLMKSAQKRNLEFNLTDYDVKLLLKRKTCYYTGIEFTTLGDYHRTVDRIDNTKGYVKGNVVACTHIANQLKNELLEKTDRKWNLGIKELYRMVNLLKNM